MSEPGVKKVETLRVSNKNNTFTVNVRKNRTEQGTNAQIQRILAANGSVNDIVNARDRAWLRKRYNQLSAVYGKTMGALAGDNRMGDYSLISGNRVTRVRRK